MGVPVNAHFDDGHGSANASASPTSLSILVIDSEHFSSFAPAASAFSSFDFSIEGDGRDVVLAFTITTLGIWFRDETSNFALDGGFGASLFSSTSVSPVVRGNFVDLQFGGTRAGGGQIGSTPDYYTAPFVYYDWNGSNPGNFILVSTFRTGDPSAGHLDLSAIGGAGNSSIDFSMGLTVSIYGDGSPGGGDPGYASGIGDLITGGGTRIGISGAGIPGGIPEPAAWALMILGFGGVGATLRRRRGLMAGA